MRIRSLDWRGALMFAHRWLGVAGCLLFIAWFASGIVMIYARMPELRVEERRARAPLLDLSTATHSLIEAAHAVDAKAPLTVQVTMLGSRPVYRFTGATSATVFADTGEVFAAFAPEEAVRLAKAFAPEHAATLRYDGLVTRPDQWTLQTRAHLPLHRIAFGDDDDSYLYVSGRTGEAVMKTTGRARFWAYLGPVTHWIYFPWLRRNGPLWTDVIIWSSSIGCILCLTGLIAGLLRFSPRGRFRVCSGRAMSPYVGVMKWHHYAGLLFGVVTLTWTFSGLLSMGPFNWLSNDGLTRAQRQTVTGSGARAEDISLNQLRVALTALGSDFEAKELTLLQFRGEPYWLAFRAPGANGPSQRLVSALHPEQGSFQHFAEPQLRQVAEGLMSGTAMIDAVWLQRYDAYYYDRQGARPLPVLRARYADPDETWVYFDPGRGAIALVSGRLDRANRWLYHGLHSFDFPALYDSRPAWDVVVIGLSLGGIALGATSLIPAWRRLRRLGAQWRATTMRRPRASTHGPLREADR